MLGGRIVETGGPELAVELHKQGYDRIRAAHPEAAGRRSRAAGSRRRQAANRTNELQEDRAKQRSRRNQCFEFVDSLDSDSNPQEAKPRWHLQAFTGVSTDHGNRYQTTPRGRPRRNQ